MGQKSEELMEHTHQLAESFMKFGYIYMENNPDGQLDEIKDAIEIVNVLNDTLYRVKTDYGFVSLGLMIKIITQNLVSIVIATVSAYATVIEQVQAVEEEEVFKNAPTV